MKHTTLVAALSLAMSTASMAAGYPSQTPASQPATKAPLSQRAPQAALSRTAANAPAAASRAHYDSKNNSKNDSKHDSKLLASPNEPSRPTESSQPNSRMTPLALNVSQDCSSFIGQSGQALVTALSQATPECVGALFNIKGNDARLTFTEANMLSVAVAIRDRAAGYTGVDTTGIESLVTFLRAALFVQFYNPDDVPAYGGAVKTDIQTALTALFANGNIWTVSDSNASVLKETLILVDSANLGAAFNDISIKVLTDYDAAWQANAGMSAAANAVFTTLFRAQWDDELQALFATDQRILDALNNFQANNRQLLGTNTEYLLVNSVRELSRLYYIEAMHDRVAELVKGVLNSTSKTDASKVLWLAAAEMADYYDRAHCDQYSLCGFKAQLEADTLSFNWKCSDTLKMRAQDLYRDQAGWACDVLTSQESYFHSKLETNHIPVANDNNDDLELVIFNSSSDYKSFAGSFFGINTDNGGMYLEGSPASLKNQARFIAYEAEWRSPDFHIWNLQHEYVHYLDGRYNLSGDFGRGTSADTIWWIEGLAEYISYRDANTRAIALGETREFSLSTIFKNNYDSGQDRIYRWGYLAVRFMFERHMDDVRQILNYLRHDQYTEYQALIDGIGSRYDNEWLGWLSSGLSSADNGIVDKGPSDSDAQASGTEGNWSGPEPTTSTDYSPCEVTDEAYRYSPSASLKLETPMECIDAQQGRASFSFANTDHSAQDIWIKIGGGWGDADIYYDSRGWANGEQNQGAGIGNGNYEVIKVSLNPDEYWHYITLEGDFGGVDMLVSTTELTADPDPAQGGGNNGGDCGAPTLDYGKLTLARSECIAGGKNSFYLWVEEDNTPISINTLGGSGDANIYFNADNWASKDNAQASSVHQGNQESLQVTANRGWRYITVDTDTEFSGVSLTVTQGGTAGMVDACAGQSPVSSGQLVSGQAVCAADGIDYYSLWVPAGTSQLKIASDHGSGDVSLYGGSNWANAQSYEAASVTQGSTRESFSVANPSEGWYYITVQSEPQSSGVAVQAILQ
ncbi:M9 family metallopeptidase [Shewanella sp. AS16]|uniref:M9 family metallopeptidase n=1 Tax=Shewanella sp. AS16 TaxID=2907625 RepID=UPI001F2928BB|nr:M9 family metallopeptidase [Shewanella sp. AS16]MCE9687602.1 M9 family metallopeptidase [Shewanella sp. AS16]